MSHYTSFFPGVQSSYSFAACEWNYEDATYVIFGAPFDATTSFFPGARDGPRVIRDMSWNFEFYLFEHDVEMSDIPIYDGGDIELPVIVDQAVAEITELTAQIIRDGKIPIMFGGEHSLTAGTVAAVKPVWYVVCDAHLDLREEYRGSRFNHGCPSRRAAEMLNNHVIIIGARSGDHEQFEYARKHIHLYDAPTVLKRGIFAIIEEIRTIVKSDSIYLSIDADVIDCCLTPALGTPEPFGLAPTDIKSVISAFAPQSVAFDYVEVTGADNGQTAAVAVMLIREFLARHWLSHQGR
jgi:agmatinase